MHMDEQARLGFLYLIGANYKTVLYGMAHLMIISCCLALTWQPGYGCYP